jgi:hypothetical protein
MRLQRSATAPETIDLMSSFGTVLGLGASALLASGGPGENARISFQDAVAATSRGCG